MISKGFSIHDNSQDLDGLDQVSYLTFFFFFYLSTALRHMSIATEVETLDDQMYEVPISFLKIMFGSKIKGRYIC